MARASEVYLVSDTRERHVHGLIETIFDEAERAHTVAQINTGDYIVCRRFAGGQPEILACIERKSLKDFAASFKDGRYENRLKMLDLRDKTGCQLYYFVEGAAFPKPTRKIARIPYGSILSAMTNLMIRDGIHVVQTADEMGTAQRLLDFVRAFDKVGVPYTYPRVEGGGEPGGGGRPAAKVAAGVPAMVMGAVEKSDDLLVVEVWAKLAGISMPTAHVVANAFSVADLVAGAVTDEELSALRTPGGRPLVKRGRVSLQKLRRGEKKTEVRVLSGVPGISPAMATQLLAATDLAELLARGPEAMAAATIQQKGRAVRLGVARAERIDRLMRHAPGAPPKPAPIVLDDDDLDELLGF